MEFEEVNTFIKSYAKRQKEVMGEISDKEKLILASTVKITEELGELCEQVLSYNSRQRQDKLDSFNKEALEHEFADAILAILMLAHDMDVDITKALSEKIQKLKEKYNV